MTELMDAESVLTAAVGTSLRPTAAATVMALLQTEESIRQTRTQFTESDLLGNWRLHFVSAGKVNLISKRLRGFFLPSFLPAQIGFQRSDMNDSAPLCVTNQITIGLIQLKFTGPARFESKKNLLGFDFIRLEIIALGQRVYEGAVPSSRTNQKFQDIAIGKLPFFAFFAVTDGFIAARGRGGGLAMWVKQSESS
jgi:hypothetical protein